QAPGCWVGLEQVSVAFLENGRVSQLRVEVGAGHACDAGERLEQVDEFFRTHGRREGLEQVVELREDICTLPVGLLIKVGQMRGRDEVCRLEQESVLELEDRSILDGDTPMLDGIPAPDGDRNFAFSLTRDNLALQGQGIELVCLGGPGIVDREF